MKVQKYIEYLVLEGATPENYMDQVLVGIKSRLDPVFDEEKVKKLKDFKNANLRLLNDPSPDDWAATSRSLKYKFTDDDTQVYILTITVDLKDAVSQTPDQDYKTSDLKKVIVKFDKYSNKDGSLEIVDKLMDRTVEPEEINPDFLIKLKVDLDNGKTEAQEEEEFSIDIEDGEKEQTNTQGQAPAQGQSKTQAQMPAEESPEQTETPTM